MWPRRSMWVREEVDRSIYLTMDLTVAEAMERGFYPEMPWSLEVTASLPIHTEEPARILSTSVFRGVPYCQLSAVLQKGLEEGLTLLRKQTAEDIMSRGEVIG